MAVRHDGRVLDRALTQRIANAVARTNASGRGAEPPAPLDPLPGDLAVICADAEARVVAYTGLRPAAPLPAPEAVQRPEWIAANVGSMKAMLDPVGEKLGGGLLGGATRSAAGVLLSVEAGALTGYLSQRVLGQYEFALVDPDAKARLLFLEPNIALAARRLKADPEQLLTWIAFHEVTHAVQFAGVPWLRPYLAGLLSELLESLDVKFDARALRKLPSLDDVKGLVEAVRKDGLVGALGSGTRRELLDRVQGVMGVIEGHAEHVMDIVGAAALPDLDALRSALDRRRQERSPLLAILERLIGLEAKLRQYEDGKRFCDTVAAGAGAAGLHRVFDGPEQLPTAAELQDPEAWIRRVGVPAAA